MEKMFIGIDPGASGGIAIITPDSVMHAFKMPETEHDTNNIISRINAYSCEKFCVLEKVGAMPGQGVSSMFKFGKNYGMLRGMLVANKIPFTDVIPRTWQKELSVKPRNKKKNESKTIFKNRLKGMAQQLYPDIKITLATADAILIAYYCKLINK